MADYGHLWVHDQPIVGFALSPVRRADSDLRLRPALDFICFETLKPDTDDTP